MRSCGQRTYAVCRRIGFVSTCYHRCRDLPAILPSWSMVVLVDLQASRFCGIHDRNLWALDKMLILYFQSLFSLYQSRLIGLSFADVRLNSRKSHGLDATCHRSQLLFGTCFCSVFLLFLVFGFVAHTFECRHIYGLPFLCYL